MATANYRCFFSADVERHFPEFIAANKQSFVPEKIIETVVNERYSPILIDTVLAVFEAEKTLASKSGAVTEVYLDMGMHCPVMAVRIILNSVVIYDRFYVPVQSADYPALQFRLYSFIVHPVFAPVIKAIPWDVLHYSDNVFNEGEAFGFVSLPLIPGREVESMFTTNMSDISIACRGKDYSKSLIDESRPEPDVTLLTINNTEPTLFDDVKISSSGELFFLKKSEVWIGSLRNALTGKSVSLHNEDVLERDVIITFRKVE